MTPLEQASQHISENLMYLTENFPNMKVVVLVHNGNNDISMISNTFDTMNTYEILTRSMASCFEPMPKGTFSTTCKSYVSVIKPLVENIDGADGLICFWDKKIRKAAMLTTLGDCSLAIAIICEHLVRVIGASYNGFYELASDTRVLH